MNETAINWTDETWNPASGCIKISPGCKHCYAETLAEKYRGKPAFPNGFDPMLRPWKLGEPFALLRRDGPSLIFVNSTSDLFLPEFVQPMSVEDLDECRGEKPIRVDADVGDCYVDLVMSVIDQTPDHRYQILTKRPELAAAYFAIRGSVPKNVWMGTTIERDDYVSRADALRKIDATVRFISAEPLLGPLPSLDLTGIHWLITGGESGDHMKDPAVAEKRGMAVLTPDGWAARPDRVGWAVDVGERAVRIGAAWWHKQWGGVRPHSAGRALGGRTYDGMPTHVDGAMPPGYDHAARKQKRADAKAAKADRRRLKIAGQAHG